jgi:hypothetical protein
VQRYDKKRIGEKPVATTGKRLLKICPYLSGFSGFVIATSGFDNLFSKYVMKAA